MMQSDCGLFCGTIELGLFLLNLYLACLLTNYMYVKEAQH